MRPRILVIRARKPVTGGVAVGGDIRATALEQSLCAVGDVQFAQGGDGSPDPDYEKASATAAKWGVLKRWGVLPGRRQVDITDLARGADIVFLHHFATYWWTGVSDPRRAILDIGDISSQFLKQGLRRGSLLKRPAKWLRYGWTRVSERMLIGAFRFSLVCSEEDRRYLNHPGVRVVPNCYQPHPLMAAGPEEDARYDLLFVGTLFYPPNLEGLQWFVEAVWPMIRREMPAATLTVVGRAPTPVPDGWRWLKAPGIELLGTVPDIGPYVRSAKVEICPLQLGGGTRIKLIESLAFGTPAVSTSIGAYGLPMADAEGLFRGDTPEAFAKACLELLADPAARMRVGAAGQAYVRDRYSPQVVRDEMAALVAAIGRKTEGG